MGLRGKGNEKQQQLINFEQQRSYFHVRLLQGKKSGEDVISLTKFYTDILLTNFTQFPLVRLWGEICYREEANVTKYCL